MFPDGVVTVVHLMDTCVLSAGTRVVVCIAQIKNFVSSMKDA